MKVKSRLTRWAMFAVSPVSRLSMPTTVSPRSRRVSARWEPMKPAAPVMTTRGIGFSVRVLVEEPLDHGQPHDLEVQHQRPVLDVVQVVLDALLDGRVAAPAVDLGPAGQAGADLVAQHVLGDALLELVDEERSLGAR